MKSNIDLIVEFIETTDSGTSKEEVLYELVNKLEKQRFVNDKYYHSVIKREKEYPTAISFPDMNVALSHASSENVMKSAIAIGKCTSPIIFQSMEREDEVIPVETVFVLALKNPDEHLYMLERLMGMFGDKSWCRDFMAADNQEEVYRLVDSYLSD